MMPTCESTGRFSSGPQRKGHLTADSCFPQLEAARGREASALAYAHRVFIEFGKAHGISALHCRRSKKSITDATKRSMIHITRIVTEEAGCFRRYATML